jgi:hypothetical protein
MQKRLQFYGFKGTELCGISVQSKTICIVPLFVYVRPPRGFSLTLNIKLTETTSYACCRIMLLNKYFKYIFPL